MQTTPGWIRAAFPAGALAVLVYVASWMVAGWLRDGYDPAEQAISELFELGAPVGSRAVVVVGLILSGAAFPVLAVALHRVLPGRGWLVPALLVLAGLGTLGVVAAPCSPGCPGAATSMTDRWHAITAGVGYGALVAAPIAVAWRVRGLRPRLARWSLVLGGLSGALFLVHVADLVPVASGMQQRLFNTLADAWYVAIAWWGWRETAPAAELSGSRRPASRAGPSAGTDRRASGS